MKIFAGQSYVEFRKMLRLFAVVRKVTNQGIQSFEEL